MLISQEELKNRLDIMSNLGVSHIHRKYLIDSVNDSSFEHFVQAVDNLSSKALLLGNASNHDAMRKRIEEHLEARQVVIEKFKESVNNDKS